MAPLTAIDSPNSPTVVFPLGEPFPVLASKTDGNCVVVAVEVAEVCPVTVVTDDTVEVVEVLGVEVVEVVVLVGNELVEVVVWAVVVLEGAVVLL